MFVSLSVTCKDKKEAKKIAEVLLRKKFIACANIFPVYSLYWWKKKIERANEVYMILKTVLKNATKVKKEIIKWHSYKVPAIIIEKVTANKEYLKWAKEVTKG